jgi:hypothetical protein
MDMLDIINILPLVEGVTVDYHKITDKVKILLLWKLAKTFYFPNIHNTR